MSDPTTSDLEKSNQSSAPALRTADAQPSSSAANDATVKATTSSAGESEGQILAEYVHGFFKLSMWIPKEFTGRVLGKKGVIIAKMLEETHARQITVLSAVGDSLWVAVAIIGDWKSISMAYKAISDIVEGEVDDVVLECTLKTNKQFFIHGKTKLTAIKSISAKSEVRVFLPETDPKIPSYAPDVPMTLEGSFEGVRKAVALLEREAIAYRDRYVDVVAGKKNFHKPATSTGLVPAIPTDQGLWPIVETKEKEVEKKTDSAPVSARTKETVVERQRSNAPKAPEAEKFIDIPSKIAALMLPKSPLTTSCPMNHIQYCTQTIITQISPSEDPRCKVSAGDEKLSEAKEASAKAKSNDIITFRIQGSVENVNTTHECLQQIIDGELIRNVLAKLKGEPLSRREDSDKHRGSRERDRERERERSSAKRFSGVMKESHGRDREREGDVRPEPSTEEAKEKDRERKPRPVSSGPPAKEDKTVEKEKEKEGPWRREKLPEKTPTVATSSDRSKRRGKPSSSSSGPPSKAAPLPEKESKKPESKEDSTTKKGAKFVKKVT